MPANRKKVKTIIVEPSQRKEAYEFIKKEVSEGKGVFVIYPKIDSAATKLKELTEKNGGGPASAMSSSAGFSVQNYPTMSLSSLAVNEVKALKEEYERFQKKFSQI